MNMNPNKPSRAPLFLFGVLLGILGMIFLPNYVRPYIPQWATGKTIVVKGAVTAKQKKEKVLLLTVDTPQGVLLATFNKKVDEINLLVNEKDSIEFTLPKYMPFIEDPKIIRVVKEQQLAPEPAPVKKPQVQRRKKVRPRQREKPPAAAPVPPPVATENKPADPEIE